MPNTESYADIMTTEVRLFNYPKSLAERLAASSPLQKSSPIVEVRKPPRSIPQDLRDLSSEYRRMPMATPKGNSKGAGITFAGQDDLPKLPIPELSDTCERYIQALKQLQTPRERAETRHAVEDFLREDGPELQENLKKYAQGKTSYIEQFCETTHHDGIFFITC